ncbi:ADAM 17-like protease [Gryllus bimaculatus]|nr:ADAM 17-like protease [Gryllus bimaculatus]
MYPGGSTATNGGAHIHDLTIGYVVDGKDYVLDLRLNRELIPESYFERYQHNGRHVVNRPTGKDVELCQYQGRLRGVPGSWAAISTCHGLSGVIFDGEELHYLERGPDSADHTFQKEEHEGSSLGSHYLYKHSDLTTNHSCGYSGTPHHILESQEINRILRYKRETEIIRGPYNANKQSRYVELVLVVDHEEYKKMEENLHAVYYHCKEIANIINSLYVPLNIFIALVGVVVWTENDEITLSSNGDQTLQNFLQYRRNKLAKEHPNDNAQLLTRVQFEGGVVGKALKGPICTYEFSGGVSTDHSEVVGLVATTVAHEMGHNFGMEHDTSECKCPSDRCIMASSSNSMRPTQWSSCSLEYLALAFEHGMDYCLRNKPKSLFDGPVCGNGFVEAGEQCDCGLKESCDNPCCNATTCMLYANASCATGECCDLQTCRPKTAGTICRTADHECDLPEYCSGQSEYCPGDVYKMDGETCDRGKAFCYQGSCRTHSDQCRLLWGPSGKSSDMQCYQMNNKGTRHGNCGYNKLNQSFLKCTDEDVYCGMLHCKHLNERLEFGMESVAILSHSFINSGGSIIPCRTAIVDLGLNEVDPGLAPDGAKCGDGKMCVNQRCRSVGSLRLGPDVCPQDCNGNGVCNSKGHCHCKTGFAPPFCNYPGTGGSEDSGPASDPHARKDVMTALYVIFLGIVPFVALVALFMYYTRRNVKHWWKKGGRSPSHVAASDNQGLPPYVVTQFCSNFGQRLSQLCRCRSCACVDNIRNAWTWVCMKFSSCLALTRTPSVDANIDHQNAHTKSPAMKNPMLINKNIEISPGNLVFTTNTCISTKNDLEKREYQPNPHQIPTVTFTSGSSQNADTGSQNDHIYENIGTKQKKKKSTGFSTQTIQGEIHSVENEKIRKKIGTKPPGTSKPGMARKNSKGLQLMTDIDPMRDKLLKTPDSVTPDTPPIVKFSDNSQGKVCQQILNIQSRSKTGEKKTQHRISRGNSMAFLPERNFSGSHGLEISSPIPADAFSSDNALASLLPKADAASGLNNSSSGSPASLQSNLFGQFKGFSITPLPSVPTASSQAKPPSPPSRNITSNHVAPPVVPSLPAMAKPTPLPPKNTIAKNTIAASTNVTTASSVTTSSKPSSASRPLISSPVLDATTCTAKELIDAGAVPAVPTRPAPQVPGSSTPAPVDKPARPVSSPNALSALAPTSLPETSTDDKKRKDSGGNSYPTLTRLASFMMRSQNAAPVSRTQSQSQNVTEKTTKKSKPVEGTNSLPRKVNKLQIDREVLRNLEISNPIPQQEIEIPQKAVPVRAAPPVPDEEDSSKNVVMRAQSLRGSGPITQRPAIPTFGSMRQPPGTKRPTSIPSCTRPTSPPPRPPPPPTEKPGQVDPGIIGLPGYQNPPGNSQDYSYDDCLNLMPANTATLAKIDEDISPSPRENIYAVIEESPPERERRKLGNGADIPIPLSPKSAPETPPGKKDKFEYTSPSFNEYKTPKPIDNTVSAGSVESVGLLSEIVNEIQARNMESIYSTSSLGRKKKKDGSSTSDDESVSTSTSGPPTLPDKTSTVAASNSSLGTYVNAPYTTSSIYKPMGSVYSNVSSQNSSGPGSKPSSSSASSSSGYLSPMNMVNNGSSNTKSAETNQEKKNFRTGTSFSPPVSSSSSFVPLKPSNKPTEPTTNVSSYKPYSSSLNRSLGPLASSFRSSGSSQTDKDNKSNISAESTKQEGTAQKPTKNINTTLMPSVASDLKPNPSLSSITENKVQTKSILPNKSSLHSTAAPPTSSKPVMSLQPKSSGSDVTKTSQIASTNNTNLPRPGVNVGKTPDVVSSCAVGGSAGKSPDVVGGAKIDSKVVNKQTVEPNVHSAPKPSIQSRISASGSSGINRTQSAGNSANKVGSTTVGKPTPIHSSFRGGVGKSPQPAPKTFSSKVSGDTSGVGGASGTPTVPEKKTVLGTAARDMKSGVGRGSSLNKSASDVGTARAMPIGARAAASKLSHVASLQQKFETAATGNEKNSPATTRPAPSAPSKLKPNVGSKLSGNAGIKK